MGVYDIGPKIEISQGFNAEILSGYELHDGYRFIVFSSLKNIILNKEWIKRKRKGGRYFPAARSAGADYEVVKP